MATRAVARLHGPVATWQVGEYAFAPWTSSQQNYTCEGPTAYAQHKKKLEQARAMF